MSAFTAKISTKYHKQKPSANHLPAAQSTPLTFRYYDISNTAKYQPEKLTSIENCPINHGRHIFLEEESVTPPPEANRAPRARHPTPRKQTMRSQWLKSAKTIKYHPINIQMIKIDLLSLQIDEQQIYMLVKMADGFTHFPDARPTDEVITCITHILNKKI